MNVIEMIEYAPEWLQKIAKTKTAFHPNQVKGVALIRLYTASTHPTLRDRTEEYKRMLPALVNIDGSAIIEEFMMTGSDLHKMGLGFPAVGAMFMHDYRLLII